MSDHGIRRRREKTARQRGEIPCSRDIPFALMLSVAAVVLLTAAPGVVPQTRSLLGDWWQQPATTTSLLAPDHVIGSLRYGLLRTASVTLVALGLLAVAAAIGHWVQIRWVWRPANVVPRADRISPHNGLRRLFGQLRPTSALWLCGRPAALALAVALWTRAHLAELYIAASRPLSEALAQLRYLASHLILLTLAVIGALAILDYLVQRYRFRKRWTPTPEEIRREVQAIQNDVTLLRRQQSRNNRRLTPCVSSTKSVDTPKW